MSKPQIRFLHKTSSWWNKHHSHSWYKPLVEKTKQNKTSATAENKDKESLILFCLVSQNTFWSSIYFNISLLQWLFIREAIKTDLDCDILAFVLKALKTYSAIVAWILCLSVFTLNKSCLCSLFLMLPSAWKLKVKLSNDRKIVEQDNLFLKEFSCFCLFCREWVCTLKTELCSFNPIMVMN